MNCWAMADGAASRTTADATEVAMSLVRIGISFLLMAGRKLAGATSGVNPCNCKAEGPDRRTAQEVPDAEFRRSKPLAMVLQTGVNSSHGRGISYPCAPHGL